MGTDRKINGQSGTQIRVLREQGGERLQLTAGVPSQLEPLSLVGNGVAALAATYFALSLPAISNLGVAVAVIGSACIAALFYFSGRRQAMPARFGWWWLALVAARISFANAVPGLAFVPIEVPILLGLFRMWRDDLRVAKFAADGLDLRGVEISRVIVEDAEFTDANMEGALFEGVTFRGCRFNRTSLRRATIRNCEFVNCSFRRTEFGESVWSNCDLQGAPLTWSSVRGVRFDRCDLRGIDLENADLRGTEFRDCRMGGVRLAAAEFDATTLFGPNIDPNSLGAVFHRAAPSSSLP